MIGEVHARDIIQLVEGHRYAGCLFVVSEPRPWGVIAYMQLPGPCEGITIVVDSNRAFVRLAWDEFNVTGGRVPDDERFDPA